MKHQTNPAIAQNRIYKSLVHSWVWFRVGTPTGTIYSDRFKNPTECDHYFARKKDGTLANCEFCNKKKEGKK